VALITPLHGRVHEQIEKRFRGSVWRLKEELPEKLAALSQRMGTHALCEKVLDQIAHAVRVTRAAFVLERNDGVLIAAHRGITPEQISAWLASAQLPKVGDVVEEEAVFPFHLALGEEGEDGKATAWLLAGPRPDGTPCNRDEREALAALAAPIARALATAEARDELENRTNSL